MPPGASRGPVFAEDGQLIGLVVEQLYGESFVDDRKIALRSICYAFIPGEVLLRELRPCVRRGESDTFIALQRTQQHARCTLEGRPEARGQIS
jgi:hypothetical protein